MFVQCAAPHKLCELQGEVDGLSSLQFVWLSKLQWAHQQAAASTVILYLRNCFSNTVSALQHNDVKRFSKLQKQGLPIPSMGFTLAMVDTGHKHDV
jgi:hypothetical protein